MVYKIVQGINGCPFDNVFAINNCISTRNNGFKLYKQYSHLTPENIAFLQRVVNDFNSLPRDVIQSPNVFLFKKKLEHWQQLCFDFL